MYSWPQTYKNTIIFLYDFKNTPCTFETWLERKYYAAGERIGQGDGSWSSPTLKEELNESNTHRSLSSPTHSGKHQPTVKENHKKSVSTTNTIYSILPEFFSDLN